MATVMIKKGNTSECREKAMDFDHADWKIKSQFKEKIEAFNFFSLLLKKMKYFHSLCVEKKAIAIYHLFCLVA